MSATFRFDRYGRRPSIQTSDAFGSADAPAFGLGRFELGIHWSSNDPSDINDPGSESQQQQPAKQKEARQPIGRRAKFREETPVTRQNEEPNFTLTPYCNAQS